MRKRLGNLLGTPTKMSQKGKRCISMSRRDHYNTWVSNKYKDRVINIPTHIFQEFCDMSRSEMVITTYLLDKISQSGLTYDFTWEELIKKSGLGKDAAIEGFGNTRIRQLIKIDSERFTSVFTAYINPNPYEDRKMLSEYRLTFERINKFIKDGQE